MPAVLYRVGISPRRRGQRKRSGDDADFASLVGDARTVLVNRQVVLDEHESLAPATGAGSEEAHRAESGVRSFERDRIRFHFAPPDRGISKRNAGFVARPVRRRTILLGRDVLGRFRSSILHSRDETGEGPPLFPGRLDFHFPLNPQAGQLYRGRRGQDGAGSAGSLTHPRRGAARREPGGMRVGRDVPRCTRRVHRRAARRGWRVVAPAPSPRPSPAGRGGVAPASLDVWRRRRPKGGSSARA